MCVSSINPHTHTQTDTDTQTQTDTDTDRHRQTQTDTDTQTQASTRTDTNNVLNMLAWHPDLVLIPRGCQHNYNCEALFGTVGNCNRCRSIKLLSTWPETFQKSTSMPMFHHKQSEQAEATDSPPPKKKHPCLVGLVHTLLNFGLCIV